MTVLSKPSVYQDSSGKWVYRTVPRGINPAYKDLFLNYLNIFGPLFEKAKNTCEFEFILSLIRPKGVQNPGWDPFASSQYIFRHIGKIQKKLMIIISKDI